ncbi:MULTISPECIES: hypothetical protein [Hymenobacter]|uniref:Uncharacterized protein n=1 Tax=Hymenobacter mucosus TaxID=1411120 RepID=A0A238V381_9BACT|nr:MULTISPECIES: hypothetical protein [Hymenobacter]SNR28726.1 hypothetical protein SAMN06269173_10140 [Hymenobacter mucosus]
MRPTYLLPPGSTPHFPPARAALRDLYRAARHIRYADPYAASRLARIADQAEYFLQEWPDTCWPDSITLEHPLPSRHVLLSWVATAKREAAQPYVPASHPWSYTRWQQVTTILLSALVPFA